MNPCHPFVCALGPFLALAASASAQVFEIPPLSPVGGAPRSTAIADFDGDGTLDVAVLELADRTVSILRGDGHGGLGPRSPSSVGILGYELVTADVDGVNGPDLVALSSTTVAVLRNDGSGHFGPPALTGGLFDASSLAAGDFNGDGRADIAVTARQGINFCSAPGLVHVFLASPQGLLPPIDSSTTCEVHQIALADFDGDGRLDAVVSALGAGGVTNVLLGQGDGTFLAGASYRGNAARLTVGDVQGDGKVDIVRSASGTISVLKGDGHGAFRRATERFGSIGFGGVPMVADFTGDGRADVLVVGTGLALFESTPPGGYRVSYQGIAGLDAAVGDLDHDGDLDVVAVRTWDDVAVLQNPGSGRFTHLPWAARATENMTNMAVVHLGAHGDAVVTTGMRPTYLSPPFEGMLSVTPLAGLGAPARTLSLPVPLDLLHGNPGLLARDLDADGLDDLLVIALDPFPLTGFHVLVLSAVEGNDFVPRFVVRSTLDVPSYPTGLGLADFDQDGDADLVAATINGTVELFRGNGNGDFAAAGSFPGSPNGLASLATGDFTGDGRADVAAGTYGEGIVILPGNGQGGFGPRQLLPYATVAHAILAADVDADGDADLAVVDAQQTLSVFLRSPSGYALPVHYIVGEEPNAIAAGDLTGDGRLDLLASNIVGNTVAVLRGLGDGTFVPGTVVQDAGPIAIHDADHDDRLDLLIGRTPLVVALRNVTPPLRRPASTSDVP